MTTTADVVVIGGGVVGLAAARCVARRHPGSKVVVLEKERAVGAHASGRNSGVLHAGFYYAEDSLKARWCAEGALAWKALCAERGVAVNDCGKLVVARSEDDHEGLEVLAQRGRAVGVPLERVDEAQVRELEPYAKTAGWALYSPRTATVDPGEVMRALADDASEAGVEVRLGAAFRGRREDGQLQTSDGPLRAGVVLNTAGLFADRVAAEWDCGARFRLVAFRGAYLLGGAAAPPLRRCIYPVPDLGMPFLGVHFTTTPGGTVKIGPTALPARWREDYGGLAGGSARDAIGQVGGLLHVLGRNPGVRRLAVEELRKLDRSYLVRQASRLARQITPAAFLRWGRPGVRAQLVARDSGALVLDFVIERVPGAVHVLNAVSPAFTCALPFAEHLADEVEAAA